MVYTSAFMALLSPGFGLYVWTMMVLGTFGSCPSYVAAEDRSQLPVAFPNLEAHGT